MKKLGKILKTVYWFVTGLLLLLAVTAATFAWFTTNRTVSTDTATSRTDQKELKLEISRQGGSGFSPVEVVSIVQVNQTDRENLLPVSTVNLKSFVSNSSTIDNQAKNFHLVEKEANYYHGRIYLRASAKEMETGSKLNLYLDDAKEAGGDILSGAPEELTAAARLGLQFDNNVNDTVIFRFGKNYNETGGKENTIINDTKLGEGKVLSWNGKNVVGVDDPSVTLDQYTIKMTDTSVALPPKPLIAMNYNQIYQLDIYFYIEGCDPDCSGQVSYQGGNLHLAFYGVVQ